MRLLRGSCGWRQTIRLGGDRTALRHGGRARLDLLATSGVPEGLRCGARPAPYRQKPRARWPVHACVRSNRPNRGKGKSVPRATIRPGLRRARYRPPDAVCPEPPRRRVAVYRLCCNAAWHAQRAWVGTAATLQGTLNVPESPWRRSSVAATAQPGNLPKTSEKQPRPHSTGEETWWWPGCLRN